MFWSNSRKLSVNYISKLMKANLNIARKTLKRSLIKFFAGLQNKSLWSDSRTRHGFSPPTIKLVRIIYDDHKFL